MTTVGPDRPPPPDRGGGVVEHVPDDDQDRAGDSDERLEFAAAFDDAPVAFAEVSTSSD